jgi:hypothetical protein
MLLLVAAEENASPGFTYTSFEDDVADCIGMIYVSIVGVFIMDRTITCTEE